MLTVLIIVNREELIEAVAKYMIKAGDIGGAVRLCFRGGVSEEVKRELFDFLLAKNYIAFYAGEKPDYFLPSAWIGDCHLHFFLRACCVFRKDSFNMPREFPMGRLPDGKIITIRLSDIFLQHLRYDEAISSSFCLF